MGGHGHDGPLAVALIILHGAFWHLLVHLDGVGPPVAVAEEILVAKCWGEEPEPDPEAPELDCNMQRLTITCEYSSNMQILVSFWLFFLAFSSFPWPLK